MTTLLKELRLTLTGKQPQNRVRRNHAETRSQPLQAWSPAADPAKPKADLVSLFELLCLYK
jgi:hypothetical protein